MSEPILFSSGKNGIAAVIKQARLEVSDSNVAPSLDHPSRPKTPAGFDNQMSVDKSLSFYNMKTAASSRRLVALSSTNLVSDKPQSSPSRNRKLKAMISANAMSAASSDADTAGSVFSPQKLLGDLKEIESTIVAGDVTAANVLLMIGDQIHELVQFLQSLPPGTKLASGLMNTIEEIAVKFSGIPLVILHKSDAAEVLSLLRLNLRILAPMFTSSYVPVGGTFDVGIVCIMLQQCTHALHLLCFTHLSPAPDCDAFNENSFFTQNDDCDIEEENAEGQFVPMKRSPASHEAPSAGADTSNNCELMGASELLQLLDLLWAAVDNERRDRLSVGKPAILPCLLEAAHYLVQVFTTLSSRAGECVGVCQAGAAETLMRGVKVFHAAADPTITGKGGDEANYLDCLAQALAVLRNLSCVEQCRGPLLEQSVVAQLCLLTKSYLQQPRVMVNCARVLAKLFDGETELPSASSEDIHCLVNVVIHEAKQMGGPPAAQGKEQEQEQEWPGEHTWAILTRICFTLGNLTTTNEKNRLLIGVEFGLVDHLLLLLQVCAESLQRMRRRAGSDSCSDISGDEGSADDANSDARDDSLDTEDTDSEADVNAGEREFVDATIKLVRLLANLSIDEKIGTALGSKPDTLEMLETLLLSARKGTDPEHEELLLNVIAACTNVTYYSSQPGKTQPLTGGEEQEWILQASTHLSAHLVLCLHHKNNEVVLEAARVLGNLTRTAAIRSSLIDTRADETLVILLKHDQWDIVAAVTGVLVNLSADAHCKAALLKPSSHLLIAFSVVLRKINTYSMELSCLICQALYNLLLGAPSMPPAGSGGNSDSRTIQERIHKTLAELNSTIRNGVEDSGTVADEWVSFLKVSSALMALIEKHRISHERVGL